jgi:regulatory protein
MSICDLHSQSAICNLQPAMPSAYLDALHLLARRALTVAECRSRLADRNHPDEQIDAAIAHLLESGGLDDGKLARAYARTAVETKGRGRLRVMRDLQARGVTREIAAEAIGEIFGDKDERTLVTRAVQKKLRGKARPANAAEHARLYQHLMRQGFTSDVVVSVLRKLRPGGGGTVDRARETGADEDLD